MFLGNVESTPEMLSDLFGNNGLRKKFHETFTIVGIEYIENKDKYILTLESDLFNTDHKDYYIYMYVTDGDGPDDKKEYSFNVTPL